MQGFNATLFLFLSLLLNTVQYQSCLYSVVSNLLQKKKNVTKYFLLLKKCYPDHYKKQVNKPYSTIIFSQCL